MATWLLYIVFQHWKIDIQGGLNNCPDLSCKKLVLWQKHNLKTPKLQDTLCLVNLSFRFVYI